MEPNLLTTLGPIIVALIALGGSVLLFFQNSSQTNKSIGIEKEKLDGLVLDRAKSLYEGMINQLEIQAEKLRENIERLEKDIAEERGESTKLRLRIKELENEKDILEEDIYQLKLRLSRLENNVN